MWKLVERLRGAQTITCALACVMWMLTAGAGSAAAMNFTVNTTADAPDPVPGDGECDITADTPLETDDLCTLRAAIMEANANVNQHDTITFSIPATDPGCAPGSWCTINLLPFTNLPPLTDPAGTFINGLSQGNLGTIQREEPGVRDTNFRCGVLQFIEPSIAINANRALQAMTIAAGSADNRIVGISIYNASDHAVLAEPGAGTPTKPNVLESMFLGVLPNGNDPVALRNTGFGAQQQGEVPGYLVVTRSIAGYNGLVGIDGERNFSEIEVTYNDVFENGWASGLIEPPGSHDGIDINGVNSLARCNLSHNNVAAVANGGGGNGIEVGSTLNDAGLDNNVVEYNTVQHNRSAGISIRKGARGNFIYKNVSAHNVSGISVNVEKVLGEGGLVLDGAPTNRNGIYRNSTFLNMIPPATGTGIDLQNETADKTTWLIMPDGQNSTPATGQDSCDPDTGAEDGTPDNLASNDLQNRPELQFAQVTQEGKVRLSGMLNSRPSRDYLIQFFSTPSSHAIGLEGERFIGQIVVTTTALCVATFDTPFFTPEQPVEEGDLITATATHYTASISQNNPEDWWSTSEYSGGIPTNQVFAAGKVTGGGYIQPLTLTACEEPCVDATDKRANFGFVAQFKRREPTVPEGHINFVWKPGNVHFSSLEYRVLEVLRYPNGDGEARWWGEGKLNNQRGFCFRANVHDFGEPGSDATTPDSFRIKIWVKDDADCSSGDGPLVVYDNGSDAIETPLSGGNIQIHHP